MLHPFGRRVARAVSVAVLLLTFPQAAHAGETESKTFFARGRELRLGGNCKDAIDEFRKALDAYPEGLGSLRNIAECEEELKRPASARRSWWALRVAVLESQSDKYLGWDKDAEEAFARLAPSVATVTIRVKNAVDPRVVLNGRPLTPSLLGTALEQDVGELLVVLEDGGAVPTTKKLTLEAGQKYEVELVANPRPIDKDPKKITPPVVTPPPNDGPSPLVISGGVALGLAGLAAGGLIGSVVIREDALGEVEDQCPNYESGAACPGTLRETADRGETAATLVNAFAIGGGIAAAAGVGLLVAGLVTGSSPNPSPATGQVQVTAAPSPEGGFIGVTMSF